MENEITKREKAYAIVLKLCNFATSKEEIEHEVDYILTMEDETVEELYFLSTRK